MKFRYAVHSNGKQKGSGTPGRNVDPDTWCTGPDPVRHDKYYAYLKHQSQANYRKEEYSLTWEDWESLWTDELWFQRGRGSDCVSICRLDYSHGWHLWNVEILSRLEHLKRQNEQKELSKQ